MSAALYNADIDARRHEERLVANGWRFHIVQTQKTMETETLWDEAVAHVALRFDRAWVDANIIQYFLQTHRQELVIVLDGADRPIVAAAAAGDGAALQRALATPIGQLTRPLRDQERLRGPFVPRNPTSAIIAAPISATTAAMHDGAPIVLSASLVQPDFGKALPEGLAPIVVIGRWVDTRFLDNFAAAYLLQDLKVTSGEPPPSHNAAWPIPDIKGAPVATLTWHAATPTRTLINDLVAPTLLLLVVLTGALIALMRYERARGRRLREAMEAAQAASRAKSEFLANVSHEIRTPLHGVMGMAQVLNQGPTLPAQEEAIAAILASGRLLATVLNDVVDLSKVEAGQLALAETDFDLGEVLERVRGAFEIVADAKGLALQVELDPSARGFWRGDGDRLGQILANLISNGVKFTERGSVLMRAERTSKGLMVTVSDTGPGIAPERLSELFQRFAQLDSASTRRHGGAGLGLAISRQLALLMKGDLTVLSPSGQGASFQFHAPLAYVRQGPAWLDLAKPLASAPLKVLAAEDHPINQKILRAMLEPVGIDLRIVENGQQAVEAFERDVFHVVLMDIQMPVLDGLGATQAIRAIEMRTRRARTAILAVSANAMAHQVAEYLAAGMDGHIAKPFQMEQLLEALSTAAAIERT